MSKPISIGIVEDDVRMRHYLEMVLSDNDDTKICFSVATLSSAFEALEREGAPAVCLVDMQLPDGRGTEFVTRLKENDDCLLYTSPSPRDQRGSRMPSSA